MHRKVTLACAATLAAFVPSGSAIAEEPVGRIDGSRAWDLNADPSAKMEAFNEAIGSVFPMTPDLVRQYRRIHEENERAAKENPYPEPLVDAVLVALEPGEQPAEIRVAPGIASAISFFDASGRPWPIRQFVIGNSEEFRVIQLSEGSLSISPLERIGWTNLIIALLDEPVPVVLRIVIDRGQVHFLRSVQIMKTGPNSPAIEAELHQELPIAGSRDMLAVLSGIDLPASAEKVPVVGMEAMAWLVDGDLYLRSEHPLLSPAWTGSLAGPGGLRAYRLKPVSNLLFSVDGRIVRVGLTLP